MAKEHFLVLNNLFNSEIFILVDLKVTYAKAKKKKKGKKENKRKKTYANVQVHSLQCAGHQTQEFQVVSFQLKYL